MTNENKSKGIACPFCGKSPVYGTFVTSFYYRKEHELFDNGIGMECANSFTDLYGEPIEEITNPSIKLTSCRCASCGKRWLSCDYTLVKDENGIYSFEKRDKISEKTKSTVYDQLIKLCKERGIKPSPLLRSLGLSATNLKRWQNGSTVNSDILEKLAEYFGVSVNYFLADDELRRT